jgi:transcriptional regulator with XRE-family HTH domain
MNSTIDRENFSTRLRQTLAGTCGIDSAYALTREFNHRFGGDAITVYAARKWLQGEAIPTQSKLRALARWLGVSPEWLRFGVVGPVEPAGAAAPAHLAPADLMLIADLGRLDGRHRRMAAVLVRQLLLAQQRRDGAGAAVTGP